MEYTIEERAELIVDALKKEKSSNPVEIFKNVANMDFVKMHGPEHHILDGGAVLIAYKNAGGDININEALDELMKRGLNMPAAMCRQWGVCGAVTSIGAALSIIDDYNKIDMPVGWGRRMEYTSEAVSRIGKHGGPRCCKRDGYEALSVAVDYVYNKYGIKFESEEIHCEFSDINAQCIHERCPFNTK